MHRLVAEFEQLIASELQHPVIAAPRATGIDSSNNAFLAQDFAAADSLDIVVRENGRAVLANALRVASHLAEALDYAAERHVLHGALHPRDILLSEDDIRIVGMGVSRALERVGVTAPVRRPYSAPERINDEGWDQRADVFGLAAIVYELLCGRRVAGTGSEAAESLTDVTGCDIAALQRVFALALAADPSYRYATATAFTDALKDAAASEADTADSADVNASKPTSRRPRTQFRVVTPAEDLEQFAASDLPELTLSDVEPPPVFEEPALPLTIFTEEVEQQLAAEPPPKVRLPRRRKAPAATPVAIETAGAADLVQAPGPAAEPAAMERAVIEQIDRLAVPETPLFEAHAIEPPPAYEEPRMFDEPAMFQRPPAAEELPVLEEFAPEPAPIAEPRPDAVAMPLAEPRLPAFLEPPPRVDQPRPHSPVWPIGVAAVIGLAVGFGVGYTVAIRDHVVAAPTAAAAPAPVNVAPPPVLAPSVELPPMKTEVPPAAAAPVEQPAPPAFVGRVLVRSTPPGARVIVDGKDRGQTPAAIGELARGEHRIRVLRDGYTAAERRVFLTTSQPIQSLSVPLAREPRARGNAPIEQKPKAPVSPVVETGTLVVDTRPQGATVVLDGRKVGTTPLNLGDVRAGTRSVQIELDGYRPWSASVAVKGGEQNRVTASLEK